MKLYEGGKQYNTKADLWEAIKITMWKTEPAEVKEIDKYQWIIDYSLLLRKIVTILKYKRFKDLPYVFVICTIIGLDQFLMIILHFYLSKVATLVESDSKAPFSIAYYTKV